MQLSESIHLLGDLLGQVLKMQESEVLFQIEERVRQLSKDRLRTAGYYIEDYHILQTSKEEGLIRAIRASARMTLVSLRK